MKELGVFFNPKSVAIIGVSRSPGKVGYAIAQNLLKANYKGSVYFVNPAAEEVLGKKCLASVKDIPGKVELGVVCVPGKLVPRVVRQCGKKGFKGLIVVSAGFDETGNEELAAELHRAAAAFPGMRIVGPNCLGVLHCANGLDTLFLPEYRLKRPEKGAVSYVSQSGALGSAVLDWSGMQGYGIAKFVSYGNALDVDESDLLEYLVGDKETKVVLMYVEGVRRGRKFFETAKRLAKRKPVVLLKGGVTDAGAKATASHTGSLAGSARVYRALCKQTGIIPAESVLEMFDFARAFVHLPRPRGRKTLVITDGGGYGVMAADAIVQQGLELAELRPALVEKLRKRMPEHVVLKNPLDLTGDVNNERYKLAVEAALEDDGVDLIVLILLFQVPSLDSNVVETVAELNRGKRKPLVVLSVGGEYSEVHKQALEREGTITFSYAENAVKALKALTDFHLK